MSWPNPLPPNADGSLPPPVPDLGDETIRDDETIRQGKQPERPYQLPYAGNYNHQQLFNQPMPEDSCGLCSSFFPLYNHPPLGTAHFWFPVFVVSFTTIYTDDNPDRLSQRLFIYTRPHSDPFCGMYLYFSSEDMCFHAHPGSDPGSTAGYLGHMHMGDLFSGADCLYIFRDLCRHMYRPQPPFPGWERPVFKETDWVSEALLMGRRLGLMRLNAEQQMISIEDGEGSDTTITPHSQ